MAQTTFGTTIQVSSSAITGATGKVAKLTKVGLPGITQAAIETTNMDSPGGFAEFIASAVTKMKPLNIELQLVPGDATDVALTTAASTKTLMYFQINVTGTIGKYTFQGIVTDYAPADAPVDGIYTATATIQPSGSVTKA